MEDKYMAFSYGQLRQDNLRIAAKINAVWGSEVAWVEDVVGPRGNTLPAIKSKMINGCVPGLKTPPFFGGPAPGVKRGR